MLHPNCETCKCVDGKGWMPKEGEEYWFISACGEVLQDNWNQASIDRDRREFLGLFCNKAEAIQRRDQILEFVKGLNK